MDEYEQRDLEKQVKKQLINECKYRGKEDPERCFHENVEQQISPGPHFWRPKCDWLVKDGECPIGWH